MLDMIEKENGAGVGSARYVKAKSHYLPGYDQNKPSKYILYAAADNFLCMGEDAVITLQRPEV